MGRIYSTRYKYELAIKAWENFLAQKVYLSKEIKSETRKWMKDAEIKLEYFDNPGRYEIRLLSTKVNSKFNDYSPSFFADGYELLFTSDRRSAEEGGDLRVYHAVKNDSAWIYLNEIESLGTLDPANSTIEVVNEDGKLFVYQQKKGNLFFSSKNDQDWSELSEFDRKVSSAKIESHFFINDAENRIIFASESSKTGFDLYETFLDPSSGKWTKPEEISGNINTEFNEDSPFLSHDGKKLYFSSDREGGIGGMDLYVSSLDETSLLWQVPQILPFPMNTPDDEIHLKVNPDDKSGYFCSNRINNIGQIDIYSFREMDKLSIEGKIINASTNRPIQEGRIFFMPLEYPDNYFKSEFDNGKYKLQIYDDETFIVQIEVKDSIVFEDRFEVHEVTGIETTYVKDFTINLSRPEEPIITKTKKIKASPENIKISEEKREVIERPMKIDDFGNKYRISDKVIINNIYFDFGTSKLTEESTSVLNELYEVMNRKKDIVVEIGGHTDNVGEKDFNLQLSLERANSVKEWLTSKGIESERIVTKGYGEKFPLASNDDEKEGRELNRRIEVTLIE